MNGDYERVERAIRYIRTHSTDQPSLDEVAAEIGLSPYHFQRLFRRWAGVSPKRFLQFVTVEEAKRLLEASASVLDAALEVGLSGPARLHDHFVALEAVTPGEFKRRGDGLAVRYGFHPSPFGRMFLATTERGVCGLRFLDAGEDDAAAVDWLSELWCGAELAPDAAATAPVAERIFGSEDAAGDGAPLKVLVRGTNFQLAVWKALLRVPVGRLVTYGRLAAAVGRPTASRAVGAAVGANHISYLIPCHRVIRGSGAIGGYAWGEERKRAMIGWEAARWAAGERQRHWSAGAGAAG